MNLETKIKIRKTLENLIYRFKTHNISTISAALSFFLLQASIPLLMVLVNVVSRLLKDNVEAIYSLIDFLPENAKELAIRVIDTTFINSSSASVNIITVLFALWSATKGIDYLITAINKAYGLDGEKRAIKKKLISVLYTIVFIIFVIFILVSQIYGPNILSFIRYNILTRFSDKAFGGFFDNIISTLTSPLYRIILTLAPILIISLAFGFFYRYAPNNKDDRVDYKDAFRGGLFATITIYIATFIYSFFITNFSKQSVVYGALAGILALFIWLTIVSNVLILGAELIDAIRKNYAIESKEEIAKFKEDSTSLKKIVEKSLQDTNKESKNMNEKSNKRFLRKKFRDIRYNMDPIRKKMIDYTIYSSFLNSSLFADAQTIFIYVSVNDEVETYEIIKKSLEFGKDVYVPFISDPYKREMKAVRIYDTKDLVKGEFKIPTSYRKEFIENPDLTLVPGLGFDRSKNRLGYGGGYYDRFLDENQTTSVGLFASDFEVEEIDTDEFDQKLDYIITEKEIF